MMRRYIRAADLAAIARGSFEESRQRTLQAVNAFASEPMGLIATFESRAVVADSKGALYTYVLEDVSGRLCVMSVQPFEGFRTLSESELEGERAAALRRVAESICAKAPIGADDVLLLFK